jgi:4-diphosphocytidyl-2-C-methyl-D-erythritol kinase
VKLTAKAPAKINLSLFLGGTRPDGRHELVTIFESVSLADELELTTPHDATADEVVCPAITGPNLVSATLNKLRKRGWEAPPVRIEIRKRIPVAAGLGGGSADAAAAIRLAARVAPLPAGLDIHALAAELGADVPSQLEPGVSLGTGAGDVVRPIPPQPPHALVLVPQRFGLFTADVYREADRLGLPRASEDLKALEHHTIPPLINDLQPAALSLRPEIEEALGAVTEAGAAAILCGSGPTVAGIHWGPDAMKHAQTTAKQLAPRFPGTTAAAPVDETFAAVVLGR